MNEPVSIENNIVFGPNEGRRSGEPRPGEPAFDNLPLTEQIRRAILASYLAVEHSIEAHSASAAMRDEVIVLTRAVRELSATQRHLVERAGASENKIDALIMDARICMPAPRPRAESWNDLETMRTDGGTEKAILSRDELKHVIDDERARWEAEKDARPTRWARAVLLPSALLFALAQAAHYFWTKLR